MADQNQGPTGGVTPHLTIGGGRAAEAIDFYAAAFGATEELRHKADDGERLMHAHLKINGGSVMLNDDFPEFHGGDYAPPAATTFHLQVDDADAWFEKAVAAGATIRMPLENQFWGDRYGQVDDPFGFIWSIGAPVKE